MINRTAVSSPLIRIGLVEKKTGVEPFFSYDFSDVVLDIQYFE